MTHSHGMSTTDQSVKTRQARGRKCGPPGAEPTSSKLTRWLRALHKRNPTAHREQGSSGTRIHLSRAVLLNRQAHSPRAKQTVTCVCLLVGLEDAGGDEAAPTELALVGLLSCVGPHVLLQVAGLLEALVAVVTPATKQQSSEHVTRPSCRGRTPPSKSGKAQRPGLPPMLGNTTEQLATAGSGRWGWGVLACFTLSKLTSPAMTPQQTNYLIH